MRLLAVRLGLVALGVVLAIGCLDLYFRLATPARAKHLLPLPYQQGELNRIADGDTYVAFDQRLGWALTPGVTRTLGPTSYTSNAAGLRAPREYEPSPRPGVRRIAAFGDSFTHCDEVDYPDCWTKLLEDALPNAEVLNYGVPAYGPDQAWMRYQERGQEYRPCSVLIGFMPENIHRVVNRFRPFYQPETAIVLSKPRYVLAGDGLALLPNPARDPNDLRDVAWVERELGQQDHWYYPGMFTPSPLDVLAMGRLVRTTRFRNHLAEAPFAANDEKGLEWAYSGQTEAFEVTSRVLIEFSRQVQRDGMTPVVLIFGRENDVVAKRQGKDRVFEPLLERLEQADVATIDLTDALGREARRRSVDSLIDKHYTGAGNRIVADTLAERLPGLTRSTCPQQ